MKTTLGNTGKQLPAKQSVVQVSVYFLKEEKGYVSAYCPDLDLAGQGTDVSTAMASFEVVLQIFLEETIRKGTLDGILRELGWKKPGNQRSLKPPKSMAPKSAFDQRLVEIILP
jgi:hypothetical protein